eukprot:1162016-Pelagomonas_calceolata.AAC.27
MDVFCLAGTVQQAKQPKYLAEALCGMKHCIASALSFGIEFSQERELPMKLHDRVPLQCWRANMPSSKKANISVEYYPRKSAWPTQGTICTNGEHDSTMAYAAQAQMTVQWHTAHKHSSHCFDSVQSQAYAWTQDAARPPLLFAIFRKFCNACSRVSMSAISVVASSNTFGGGALCCCDRCDSAVAAGQCGQGNEQGWWLARWLSCGCGGNAKVRDKLHGWACLQGQLCRRLHGCGSRAKQAVKYKQEGRQQAQQPALTLCMGHTSKPPAPGLLRKAFTSCMSRSSQS